MDAKRPRTDAPSGRMDVDRPEEAGPSTSMEVDPAEPEGAPSSKKHQHVKLMESGLLIDVPVDLEDKWLCKLVPEGFRVLLVAKKRNTWLFTKRGLVLELETFLPGGGFYDGANGFTALDCIYDKVCKVIYVLDCLYWNKMSCVGCDTSLRFSWLEAQFKENPKLVQTNKAHRLHLLESFAAKKTMIQDIIGKRQLVKIPQYHDKFCADVAIEERPIFHHGIVFYDQESTYECGVKAPLFCWLYCYMLPERLEIQAIPDYLMNKKPPTYVNFDTYLKIKPIKRVKKFVQKTKKRIDEGRVVHLEGMPAISHFHAEIDS